MAKFHTVLCVPMYFILYVLQACACLFVLFISSLETNELWWLSSYLSFLEVTKDGSLSMRHLIQWMEVGNDPPNLHYLVTTTTDRVPPRPCYNNNSDRS